MANEHTCGCPPYRVVCHHFEDGSRLVLNDFAEHFDKLSRMPGYPDVRLRRYCLNFQDVDGEIIAVDDGYDDREYGIDALEEWRDHILAGGEKPDGAIYFVVRRQR